MGFIFDFKIMEFKEFSKNLLVIRKANFRKDTFFWSQRSKKKFQNCILIDYFFQSKVEKQSVRCSD